jgi:hypothetical protein
MDMKNRTGWGAALILVLLAAPGRADPPPRPPITPGNVLSALGGGSVDAVAGALRGYLLKVMPSPLFEDARHWGMQKAVREVHWHGKGLRVRPEEREVLKNDGHWRKITVMADRPADTLILDLRDVLQPEEGRLLFTTFIALDSRVEVERQTWHTGKRFYSGSVRARLRVQLTLRCEALARLESGGSLLPEAVFRLRVLQSDVRFDNLVVEHIAGMGGEMAKVLGDAVRGGMKQWHPSLERDLLARANEAIVKAGDTHEVRVSLTKLLSSKKN